MRIDIKKAIIIGVIIVLISLLCWLFLKSKPENISNEKPVNVLIENIDEVDVYSDIFLYDLVTITNGDFVGANEQINTKEIGTQTITVYYEVNKKKYSYEFEIIVKDNEAPRIYGGASKTIEINYKKDLCDLVMYGDNFDKKPSCTIEGTYDINKPGSYKLIYVMSDSSNNQSEHNLTLNVVSKIESGTPNKVAKLQFKDVIANYKTDNTEVGIDVSTWQGNVDFNQVKAAGATFVMMRIGFQRTANGELTMDNYYLRNIEKAKAAGLKVGIYLYSIATNRDEAIEHANWVINKLNGIPLELPIAFDWESWANWNSYHMSFYDINEVADAFIETIEKNGYQGILYSSKSYLENIWTNKKNHKVWLAHYTNKTTYAGDYMMWQLSCVGRIAGINGDVDINILYK